MRREVIAPTTGLLPISARPLLSFVIPAWNEESSIQQTIRLVHAKAVSLVDDSHEIIVVDDGSKDTTGKLAVELADLVPLRVLTLSRNFGKEQALMAGLAAARGQAVVTLDADLQEPLDALDEMYNNWRTGIPMSYAVRAHRRDEPLQKRLCTRLFYWMIRAGAQTDIPKDARDFRLMDRKIVDVICALPERNLFMKGIFSWVGFDSRAVPVGLVPRKHGTSKFGFAALSRLGLTGLTSFSVWPLRVWIVVGATIATAAMVYGLWIAIRTAIWGVEIPGWSTLVVGMTFLGGIQLFSIGVLGEYIARIFTEVKGRPGYIVAAEHTSQAEE